MLFTRGFDRLEKSKLWRGYCNLTKHKLAKGACARKVEKASSRHPPLPARASVESLAIAFLVGHCFGKGTCLKNQNTRMGWSGREFSILVVEIESLTSALICRITV